MLDNQSNNNNNSILHNRSLRKQSTIKQDISTPTLSSKKLNLMKKISLRSQEKRRNLQKADNEMSRESFYTDRDFMIKESKEDDETPIVNDWAGCSTWFCFWWEDLLMIGLGIESKGTQLQAHHSHIKN